MQQKYSKNTSCRFKQTVVSVAQLVARRTNNRIGGHFEPPSSKSARQIFSFQLAKVVSSMPANVVGITVDR